MTRASEKTILIVDDEPDIRNFLSACIEDAGFKTETASDGEEALERINEIAPDLMTLDMVMPRKSGIKVIRTLRQDPKWSKLPIIVITAHAYDDLGNEDFKEFNAFTSGLKPRYTMEKPVTPAKLVKAIGDILDIDIEGDKELIPLSEQAEVIEMIKDTDSEMLKRISEMLKKDSSA